MKKPAVITVVILALVAPTSADETTKKTKTALEGTWKRVSGNDMVQQVKFEGDKFEVTMQRDGKTAAFKGTFKLHPKETPTAIDMKVTSGPTEDFKSKTSLGIYKVKDGELTWCAAQPGKKARPTEFSETIGDAQFLLVTFKKK